MVEALVLVERHPVLVPTTQAVGGGPGSSSFVSVTGRSVPILTGPAVGQGVVAYGATSVPYGSGVGLSMGGGGTVPGPPRLQMLTRYYRNSEVLAALEALTGRNFGFDTATWKRWLASASPKGEPEPVRRVPQP